MSSVKNNPRNQRFLSFPKINVYTSFKYSWSLQEKSSVVLSCLVFFQWFLKYPGIQVFGTTERNIWFINITLITPLLNLFNYQAREVFIAPGLLSQQILMCEEMGKSTHSLPYREKRRLLFSFYYYISVNVHALFIVVFLNLFACVLHSVCCFSDFTLRNKMNMSEEPNFND